MGAGGSCLFCGSRPECLDDSRQDEVTSPIYAYPLTQTPPDHAFGCKQGRNIDTRLSRSHTLVTSEGPTSSLLTSLPPEVFEAVCNRLPLRDVVRLWCTSRAIQKAVAHCRWQHEVLAPECCPLAWRVFEAGCISRVRLPRWQPSQPVPPRIESRLPSHVPHLTELNIVHRNVPILPSWMRPSCLRSLRKLACSCTNMHARSLARLTSLVSLQVDAEPGHGRRRDSQHVELLVTALSLPNLTQLVLPTCCPLSILPPRDLSCAAAVPFCQGLGRLQQLSIRGGGIPLWCAPALTSLVQLSVYQREFSLSPLAQLPALESLDLRVSRLAPNPSLANDLPRLTSLCVAWEQPSSLPLLRMPNLSTLTLQCTKPTSTSFFPAAALNSVRVAPSVGITGVRADDLAMLPRLRDLVFDSHVLEGAVKLSSVSQVTSLRLNGRLDHVVGYESLSQVKELSVTGLDCLLLPKLLTDLPRLTSLTAILKVVIGGPSKVVVRLGGSSSSSSSSAASGLGSRSASSSSLVEAARAHAACGGGAIEGGGSANKASGSTALNRGGSFPDIQDAARTGGWGAAASPLFGTPSPVPGATRGEARVSRVKRLSLSSSFGGQLKLCMDRDMPQLVELQLSGLEMADESWVTKVPRLQALSLCNSCLPALRDLPPGALPSLMRLKLESVEVRSVAVSWLALPNLRWLHLAQCNVLPSLGPCPPFSPFDLSSGSGSRTDLRGGGGSSSSGGGGSCSSVWRTCQPFSLRELRLTSCKAIASIPPPSLLVHLNSLVVHACGKLSVPLELAPRCRPG